MLLAPWWGWSQWSALAAGASPQLVLSYEMWQLHRLLSTSDCWPTSPCRSAPAQACTRAGTITTFAGVHIMTAESEAINGMWKKGHRSSSDAPKGYSAHRALMPNTSITATHHRRGAAQQLQAWLCRRLLALQHGRRVWGPACCWPAFSGSQRWPPQP